MKAVIEFRLNHKPVRLKVAGERMLLWVLRSQLGLTGTKYGCGAGLCGCCTVLVDNSAVRSCQLPVQEVSGKEIITIEGLAKNGKLHPLQTAFMQHNALQCGYCTPGMILTAHSLLAKNPRPSRAEIVAAMDDNLCRCGSYNRIIEAVQSAAAVMRGGRP